MIVCPLTDGQTKLLDEPIAVLGLGVRTQNCLEIRGIMTVGQLLECCPYSSDKCKACVRKLTCRIPVRLLDLPNFGESCMRQVFKALEKFGFERRGG